VLLTYAIILASSRCIQDCTFLRHVTTGYSVEYSVALYVCIQSFDRYWYNTVKWRNTLTHHFTKCTNGISHHKQGHKSRI